MLPPCLPARCFRYSLRWVDVNEVHVRLTDMGQPSEWRCSLCKTGAGDHEMWGCLSCAFVGCVGDGSQNHALDHAAKRRHPVFMDVNELSAHCQRCNGVVVDTPQSAGVLGVMTDMLGKVREGTHVVVNGALEECPDGHGSRRSQRFKELDLLETALGHYRHKLAERAVNAWRAAAEARRKAQSPVAAGPKVR